MTFSASTLNGGIVCQASDCVIERGVRNNYAKLLVARLTNRMQFDLKINRELVRLSEIVKIKSAWRGIRILYRSDPSGDLQMTKPASGGVLRPKLVESLTEESSRC